MSTPAPTEEPAPSEECGTLLEPTALPIGDIDSVVFSPRGDRAVLCLDIGAFLLDLATGAVSPIVHRAVTARGGAFDAAGRRLVLVDYDEATLWLVEIGADGRFDVRSLPVDDLVDVEVEVGCAVAPDGSRFALATADAEVGTLMIVDWATLSVEARAETAATWGIAFTPDGRHVVASGEFESYVIDASGRRVSTMPRTVSFSPDGRRIAAVGDDAPAQLMVGRLTGGAPPQWSPGRGFLPWGDPNDDVDRVVWSPDSERMAVAVGAWRELDGMDEPVFRVDLVTTTAGGRRIATYPEPHGLDSGFAALGSFAFTPGGERLLVHAEALLSEDDPEPVLALHAFDVRTGAWLGAIVALQAPDGPPAGARAALDPFGFQEGEGGYAPALSARRLQGDRSLDIDYGEVGSVIAAVTPDGWYGRLDGAPTIRADIDPYDRREAIAEWLLGLRDARGLGPAPVAPPRPAAPMVDEEAAQRAIEAVEAGLATPAGAPGPRSAPRPPGWLWTALAAVGTVIAYWWWQR